MLRVVSSGDEGYAGKFNVGGFAVVLTVIGDDTVLTASLSPPPHTLAPVNFVSDTNWERARLGVVRVEVRYSMEIGSNFI